MVATSATTHEQGVDYCPRQLRPGTYLLTRIFFLRCLALIYFVAFLVAYNQNEALLGPNGLLPVQLFLSSVRQQIPRHSNNVVYDMWEKISNVPTLLWFVDFQTPSNLNNALNAISLIGMALSLLVVFLGASNMFIMSALWILYQSIVNVGQSWYSFGWESQLLETGFLAIFLCPLLSLKSMSPGMPSPLLCVWGYRWLIFRIMLGAGLIKIRGDKCWRDLTCMEYHYETQPVPNPISTFMHQMPPWWHKVEVGSNHFVELIAPFFCIIPIRIFLIFGGLSQIFFQFMIIVSGNLSFLNWLTILPAIFCFDDKVLSFTFSKTTLLRHRQVSAEQQYSTISSRRQNLSKFFHVSVRIAIAILIGYLSIPVVQNLLSSNQVMNTSFDRFRIVNTYGAFGSITRQRTEVIFQGTHSDNPTDLKAVWLDYEFPCKPGSVMRRPCLISPYHYRLDWLMWFAAFQNYQSNPWLVHLAGKLLDNDTLIINSLLAKGGNPFSTTPPNYVRAQHYQYVYTKLGSEDWISGNWWRRKFIGEYLPPVNLKSLEGIYRQFGWKFSKK